MSDAHGAMEDFDHHTEQFAEHWREQYADLRSRCPVARTPRHGGYTVLTRYDDIKRVLRDAETFACGRDLEFDGHRTGGVTVPINPVRMGMMEMDPPQSQAYRRVLAPRFSAKAIQEYLPRMAEIVSWTVDRVVESGRIDFVDDLANPLPTLVSLDYFGLPLDKWEDYATALHKAAYREKGSARAVGALLADLAGIVAERRRTAGDRGDIVDRLLTAEIEGVVMPDETVTEMLFMLLNGGIDTSTALIASMFDHLGEHPDERARLVADPSLIPTAVDEMLRYFTPGTGVARTVVRPVEIAGVPLRPGERVLLALGSANNDQDVFPEPNAVRLDRDNNGKHLAFGNGLHRCLGAFLARAEIILVLQEVLRRLPDYEIDAVAVRRYPTIPLINGYIAIPATFTPGERVLTGFDTRLPVRAAT
ncbi:cytochrome P450 [Pseudonocardia sp. GCM10023141]|uniref:cytochrome P450 n=1 Tax=Pseudonocardia sp. GCM10023141 TaxID=3252653 RepID=UPI00360EA8E4